MQIPAELPKARFHFSEITSEVLVVSECCFLLWLSTVRHTYFLTLFANKWSQIFKEMGSRQNKMVYLFFLQSLPFLSPFTAQLSRLHQLDVALSLYVGSGLSPILD